MDRSGITQSVLSLGNPWLEPFTAEEGVELANALNEELATYSAKTGGRVVGMGVLPDGKVEDAVSVVADVSITPGLHGVVSGTKICGLAFDDRDLDPPGYITTRVHTLGVGPHG